MSFRIEEKLMISKNSLIDFKSFIFEKKAKLLYPKRIINSLYFDNEKYQMYDDSIEGLVPRKKIRIRHYPNEKKVLYLELKISSEEGRFKKRKIIEEKEFYQLKRDGIFDEQYGFCKPVLFVNYEREYFLVDDVRISIDTDITYTSYIGSHLGNDSNCAVELKANYKKNKNTLLNQFPFQRTRFSKYCNGIEKNQFINI